MMKGCVAGAAAVAMALMAAGPAQAATELTYIFQAQGTGAQITGYGNDGPVTTAFSGAILRFVVSVPEESDIAFGYADSPIILSSDETGLRFRFEPVRYGLNGSGSACVAGGVGGLVPVAGQATDPRCSRLSLETAAFGGLGTRFDGAITRVDVLAGRVGEDFSYTLLVPEPASWALMLLGFGLTGYALRRQRVGLMLAGR